MTFVMCNRLRHSCARVAIVAVLAVACARAGARTRSPGAPIPPSGPPRNGLEVIGWMRATYPTRELRSLAFNITSANADGEARARARAYALLPGRMRVDTLPQTTRSGWIRDRQRLAVFRAGTRVLASNRVDLRTLLTFDVFAQSIDTTIMWLDSARVRFALARRDELDGRRVWVVGAPAGDTSSAQFWVDAQRWRVLRVIQREPRAPSVISDLRFFDYTEILDVPVPTRVQVWREGRLVDEFRYTDFSVNPELSRRWFDLTRWRQARE